MTDPVFACTLPPVELRRRRLEVLASVRRRAACVDETPDGFVFTFARSPALQAELDEFIRFEAACCSFISMTVREVGERIELSMSAPAGAKPFVRAEFVDAEGPNAETTPPCGCHR